jgi:Domain of unknown function (DUF5666)
MNVTYQSTLSQLLRLRYCAFVTLLVACGGGGTQTAGDIGGGGTGVDIPTISVGPVGGFGSVVIAGVRYDDSTSVRDIIDDDDSGSGLKLGMQVRVEGKVKIADRSTGTANRIEMRADLRGPVTSVGKNGDRFEANGMRVRINAGTVFDGVKPDLSDLALDDNIQAHGLFSDSRDLIATRVQKRTACSGAACVYKSIGIVTASSVTSITLDSGVVVAVTAQTTFSDIANPPPPGSVIRIKSTTAPVALAVTAVSISGVNATSSDRGGKPFDEGRLEGIVTDLTATSMKASGTAVALTATTTVVPAGTALANGQRVKVDATWVSGALQAKTVTVDNGGASGSGYEFFGPITNFVSSANFQVKGQTIDASGVGIDFRNGTASDLANGRNVEVRGQIVGTTLIANRVVFK